jgi:hypothetical protein
MMDDQPRCGKKIQASYSKALGWHNVWYCNLPKGHRGQHRHER